MLSRSMRERSRSVSGSRTAVEEDWESNVMRFRSGGIRRGFGWRRRGR
jgi:hypothetical protein